MDGTDRVRLQAADSDAWMMDLHPSKITHRAPVIAADGKPLREGETVWSVLGGTEYSVLGFCGDLVHAENAENSFARAYFQPQDLTHERPDSWERLEEDAGKSPAQYCRDRDVTGGGTTLYGGLDAAMRRDLVRRAKALAERGE